VGAAGGAAGVIQGVAGMHEMSIAAEIQRITRARVEREGNGRLESVQVAVGDLTGIEPRLLVFAWEALTRGGPDEGARLEVEWRPARQFCIACCESKTRGTGSWLRLCPDCGMPLRVEGGSDLDVLELTFAPREQEGGSAP
jgi:hydrogenase nickel incorporation protein HypA/HybF